MSQPQTVRITPKSGGGLFGGLFSVETIRSKRVWVFPRDRFVEYGPEDEWWARKTNFGHEEERQEIITLPNCIVDSIGPNGVKFRTVPNFLTF